MAEDYRASAVGGPRSVVLGVDGGGSRTRARLADVQGQMLGTGEAGRSNPQAVGMSSAAREILLAIERAFQAAQLPSQPIAAACLGIAGVGRPGEREELERWAQEAITQRVTVTSDGGIVLAAGSDENWGIALIAGTGSSAWGRTRDGRTARAGGWGYLIGDEGSAFHVAQGALRSAAQAADGRGPATRLLPAILDFWALTDPMELVDRVYRSGFKPGDLAEVAAVVQRLAGEGDPVARELLTGAGDALAAAVIAVARTLKMQDEEIPIALTGGLILGCDLARARLLDALEQRGLRFKIELVNEPVAGAVRLAQKLLE